MCDRSAEALADEGRALGQLIGSWLCLVRGNEDLDVQPALCALPRERKAVPSARKRETCFENQINSSYALMSRRQASRIRPLRLTDLSPTSLLMQCPPGLAIELRALVQCFMTYLEILGRVSSINVRKIL